MAQEMLLMVGTVKGLYLFRSADDRKSWKMQGPVMPGWEIYSVHTDGGRMFAGTSSFVYGPTVRYSDDGGTTWVQAQQSPQFAKESGFTVKHIWQMAANPREPGALYTGVDEAGLFISRDRGVNWAEVESLSKHETRKEWFPGFGGLCLHTILFDPANAQRMWVAISSVGVFRTDDGGKSWRVRNKGIPMIAPMPDPNSEIGRCVHRIVQDPKNSQTLYMQFHGGVFRSKDGADSWQRIENGLPGNFGFPMCITAAGTLFTIPLEADQHRVMKDGKLAVYRSRDGGEKWEARSAGLPTTPQFVGVLRDALCADGLQHAGIYFGTSGGNLYWSRDGGENWGEINVQLPRITSVRAAEL